MSEYVSSSFPDVARAHAVHTTGCELCVQNQGYREVMQGDVAGYH